MPALPMPPEAGGSLTCRREDC